jgi:transcriptional regulator with XRE-family HTH domain
MPNPSISIKDLRERASLSQDEFAGLMGVSKRTVAYWESGEKTPHPKTYRKIDELLGNRLKKPAPSGDKGNRERALIKVLLHQVATLTAEVSVLKKEKEPISRERALLELKQRTNLVIDDLEDF